MEDLKKSLADNKDVSVDADRNWTFALLLIMTPPLPMCVLPHDVCFSSVSGWQKCCMQSWRRCASSSRSALTNSTVCLVMPPLPSAHAPFQANPRRTSRAQTSRYDHGLHHVPRLTVFLADGVHHGHSGQADAGAGMGGAQRWSALLVVRQRHFHAHVAGYIERRLTEINGLVRA